MCIRENRGTPTVSDLDFLRAVIDTIPIPTFWKDLNSCYQGCNQVFLEYEGFNSRDDIVGKYDEDLPWKNYARQYRESDRQILETSIPQSGFLESQIRLDGSKRWYKTNKSLLLNEEGDAFGIMVCYQDITDQKRAETELKASENQFRCLIDTSGTGYIVIGADGRVLETNSEYVRLAGYASKADVVGRSPEDWTFNTNFRGSNIVFDNLILGDHFTSTEVEYRHNDGKVIPVEMNVTKIKTDDGYQFLALCRDITESKEKDRELDEKDQYLKEVLNDLTTYTGIVEPDGKILFINNTALSTSGIKLSDVHGSYLYDVGWWDTAETRDLIKRDLESCSAGHPVSRKIQARMGSRGLRWIVFSAHPVSDKTGVITQLIVEGRDIHDDVAEIKQAQADLIDEKERLQVTLHSIGDAVITTDLFGIIDYMNPVAEKLTAWSLSEAIGQPITKIFKAVSEYDHQSCLDPVQMCLEQEKTISLGDEILLIDRLGKKYSILNSAAPIQDAGQNVLGIVLVFSDITESRRLSKQLAFHASHDSLTELVNRREFEARLKRAMQTARDHEYQHVLCYMDLDQFKIVNDTYGHVAGDELLRQIAALLNKTIRSRDTLARLGGDEFAILMEHCSLVQAHKIAEKVRLAISGSRFHWQNRVIKVGVSIGMVSICDTDKSSSDVLCEADAACFAAKRAGRDRIHIYQDDNVELARQRNDMQWFSRIHHALEFDRFCLYYQPIYSFNKSKSIRYELLIRMKDSEEKLIFPATFLPAAEHYAITTKIDRWVLKEAFQWLKTIPDHLEKLDHCAINISGHSLGDKDFLKFLLNLFKETGLPPEKICLEITETAAIANLPDAQEFMKILQDLGCRFALDDFGIGLSSFAYLKNLAVDYLKIDGSFVKNILTDPDDFAIVKSINEIGHTMGKLTIAEFAESPETLQCLNDMGVDFAQGYAINRPRSISEIGLSELT